MDCSFKKFVWEVKKQDYIVNRRGKEYQERLGFSTEEA